MSSTIITGPSIIAGGLLSYPAGGVPEYNPEGGPSISYQGDAFPDIRFFIQKDYVDRGGVIPSHANMPFSCVVNALPVASSTTAIAAAAATTNGTAMTLATTVGSNTGVGTAVPFVTAAGALTTGVMIEPGFGFCNTTASSTTLASVPKLALMQMWVGQWLYIPNVGNSGGTTGLFTQITAITYTSGATGSVTVGTAPSAALTGARIMQANIFNPIWGGTPNAAVGVMAVPQGGPAAPYDPANGLARTISITATNAGATGGALTVRGFDLYGFAMSETITHAGGATTKYGRKTFKVVTSVTPAFTDTQTYSVGFGDEVGIPLRSDLWEFLSVYYNGNYISSSTGYTAADTTTPATATTTDVRGSLAIGSLNNGGTGISGGAFNGTGGTTGRRLVVQIGMPPGNILGGIPGAASPMYGVTQV